MHQAQEMRDRTRDFALRVIKVYRALPKRGEARVIGEQLLRSGTAVAANYRAACRARSRPDFASEIGVVLEETDETLFWFELLIRAGIVPQARLRLLVAEAEELVRIFSASRQTAKSIANHKSQITNADGA